MQAQDKKLVWLDCDPGADDAMAIFLAAYSDKVKLLGISTVHGNSSIEKVTNNALKVLKMGGVQGIPVYRGLEQAIVRRDKINIQFHGESGIDGCVLPDTEQEAIQDDVFHKIYHTLKNQSQKVHFVATGAYSNLAILLTIYPDVKNYIEQISLMGGAVFLGNQTPAAEFNIMSDPEAAQIVFQSGLRITLAPIDLTHKVGVTQEIIQKIELYKSEFGKNVIGFLTYYMGRYKQRYGWDYAPLHDPVSVFYIINPDAFSTKYRNVEIDTVSPLCLGRTIVDEYSVTGRQPNCYVAYEINKELFWQEMLSALDQANKNSPMK
ncbi:hypothetical protein ABPG74_005451 [Tetrahymena malaccensis]